MSWQEKHILTAEQAAMIKYLRDLNFDDIGTMYLQSSLTKKTREHNAPDFRAPVRPSTSTSLHNHETSSLTDNPKNEAQIMAEPAKKGGYSLVKTASERTMLGRN